MEFFIKKLNIPATEVRTLMDLGYHLYVIFEEMPKRAVFLANRLRYEDARNMFRLYRVMDRDSIEAELRMWGNKEFNYDID